MRYLKLDPFVLLAVLVGLGVLITSSVQAQEPLDTPPAHTSGAKGVWQPVQQVLERLDFAWAEEALQRPAVAAFMSEQGLALNQASGDRDVRLGLSWQLEEHPQAVEALQNDGLTAPSQAGLWLRLQRRW